MIREVNKTLFINTENEIEIGKAITATVLHQIIIYEDKDGLNMDIELIDYENVCLLGIPVGQTYDQFKEFKQAMLNFGIDIQQLINDECEDLFTDYDLNLLKQKYKNIFS
jgi:hypothetical protein